MPIDHDDLTTDLGAIYRRLSEMVSRGEPGVLATVIRTHHSTPRHAGAKMIVHADATITGSIGGGRAEAVVIEESARVLADQTCRVIDLDLSAKLGVCGGSMEIFLEPVLQTTEFVVVGAGHIGRAMVQLGNALPFRFTVIDDREDWLAKLRQMSNVRPVMAGPTELTGQVAVTVGAAVLVASRNHDLDAAYVRALLELERDQNTEFAFLGVLGSRRKVKRLLDALREEGWNEERLSRLQMPVGLDLGAELPPEIALSILAEALAVIHERPPLTDENGRSLGLRFHRRRGEQTDAADPADGES